MLDHIREYMKFCEAFTGTSAKQVRLSRTSHPKRTHLPRVDWSAKNILVKSALQSAFTHHHHQTSHHHHSHSHSNRTRRQGIGIDPSSSRKRPAICSAQKNTSPSLQCQEGPHRLTPTKTGLPWPTKGKPNEAQRVGKGH